MTTTPTDRTWLRLSGNRLLLGLVLISCVSSGRSGISRQLARDEVDSYRERVKGMFYHGYNSYLENASDFDELQPITCQGTDTWGSFSLSLIDALDTLAILGNYSEFKRVADQVVDTIHFNHNINVSVFETNIRVVGGLLSAHLFTFKAGMDLEPGWPCSGPLLRLAADLGRRLLPAFETNTGMPFGTVNLMYGVPKDETPITCTAGVGTFIVEFGSLSRLTGDPIFERKALRAMRALHKRRSKLDLVGNHINTSDGSWTAVESGIGAGVDSFFEYLVKGSMLLQNPNLLDMFYTYYNAINTHMKREDWYFLVHMGNGLPTNPIFQSLEAFWPGLLTLVGELEQSRKTLYNYHQVWKQYGFHPEFTELPNYDVKRDGYPLRPEFIESVFYLYKATKDPHLLMIGADIIESIEYSSKTRCGFATIKNVKDHTIEDRMESFFLAETLKYLYLLFDENNFIYNNGFQGTVINSSVGGQCIIDSGGYIFNTEAHPIDSAAVYCCSAQKTFQDSVINEFQSNLNVYSMLDLIEASTSSKSRSSYRSESLSLNFEDYSTEDQKADEFEDSLNAEEEQQTMVFLDKRTVVGQPVDDGRYGVMPNISPSTDDVIGNNIPIPATSKPTMPLTEETSASASAQGKSLKATEFSRESIPATSVSPSYFQETLPAESPGTEQKVVVTRLDNIPDELEAEEKEGGGEGSRNDQSVNSGGVSEGYHPFAKCNLNAATLCCPSAPFFSALSRFGQVLKEAS